ncbi:hypothetical protein [Streptomyces sp. 058-1L]|uniref:hypothetical protein n=1 Tax=Streptomyces sp. 058-1L TaxID=2789266 RepID=UPI0039813601
MDDSKHQALDRYAPETALTRLIRIPVRIVVLVVVLPVRMVWDLLSAAWHAFDRVLLRPLGRGPARLAETLVLTPSAWLYANVLTPLGHGAAWLLGKVGQGVAWLFTTLVVAPAVALWRYVLVPAARYGVVVPLVWLYGAVLTPVGRGAAWVFGKAWQGAAWFLGGIWQGIAWAFGLLWQGIAWIFGLLWRGIAAIGRGLWTVVTWLVTTLLVTPASWLYRHILAPVGREIAAAVEVAWRIAGYLSRAVGRGIAWLARHLIGVPVAWVHRTVGTPVGHFVRDALWAPARRAAAEAGRAVRGALATARETVRQARRDAWRALAGGAGGTRSGELLGVPARTLGSTTTVPSAAQASETSLLGEKLVKQG